MKRTVIRIISFGVAIALAVVCFMITTNSELDYLRRVCQNNYSGNLYELDGSISNVSAALKKSVYSSGPAQFSTLAVQLVSESNTAKTALSGLPTSMGTVEKVNKFLSQVGDYAFYLAKKLILGGEITDDERNTLNELSKTAEKISRQIESIRIEYDRDGKWNAELSNRLEDAVDSPLQTNLGEVEKLLADYPALVYDGPFSDGVLNGEVKLLKDKPIVSKEQALEMAASILGVKNNFQHAGETGGNMPCYEISNGDMSVLVTKQGGYIAYMKKYREIGEQTVSYEKAKTIAEEYLNKNADETFVATYYFADEGVCTVNLAYKQGATLCYPDLIKVGVALDNGEVVSVEATSYITNHHIRTISTPKYSVAEAKAKLSKTLKYESVQRAIIPTDSGSEKHCYEFLCKGMDDEEVLVYIDVSTLQEEQILVLLKTDGGILAK